MTKQTVFGEFFLETNGGQEEEEEEEEEEEKEIRTCFTWSSGCTFG